MLDKSEISFLSVMCLRCFHENFKVLRDNRASRALICFLRISRF